MKIGGNYTEEQLSNTRKFVNLYSSIPEENRAESLERVKAFMENIAQKESEKKNKEKNRIT